MEICLIKGPIGYKSIPCRLSPRLTNHPTNMRASTLVAASVLALAIAKDTTTPCKGGACPAKTGNKTATQAKNTVAKPEDAKKDESKTDESSKKDNTKAATPAKEGEKKPNTANPAKDGEKKVESVEAKNGAATSAFSVAALGFVAVLALAAF